MDKNIVQLKYPIPIPKEGGGTVKVNQLEMGRFKAKHLKLLPDSFMEDQGKINPKDIIPLIAGLAEIPESAADEIDMEDLMGVAESLQGFLEKSLETGEK